MKPIIYDNTNNFMYYTQDELEKMKQNMTAEDLAFLEEDLDFVMDDYEAANKSVIYTKKDAKGEMKNIAPKDYISIATYWWPNPDTEDGLPYIQKDGQLTPEAFLFDKVNFKKFGYDLYHSSLLYYFTGNKKYYDMMKKNVYYYLLDEKTGMNPNLTHAQIIQGRNNGRANGIIDFAANSTYGFWTFNLIYKMGLVEEDFKKDFDVWVKEFYKWMAFSDYGKSECETANNHAIYWDMSVAVLADFVGEADMIKEVHDRVIERRINVQIKEDGSMPEELARTKSISYSVMALKGLYNISTICAKYNLSFWDCPSCKEKLTNAANYIFDRLILKTKPWEYKQITPIDSCYFISIMVEATKHISQDYNQFAKIDESLVGNKAQYLLGRVLLG